MFTGRAGRPGTTNGGGDEPTVDDWEGRTGSEAESIEEEEGEENTKELPEYEAGQENPSAGSGQLDLILESISALASSVALLQVQGDRERRIPQQGARRAATLRRELTQFRQAGATRKRQTTGIFPPAPTRAVPTAPAQTFHPSPALTPVNHTCKKMDGVVATSPEPRVPGFPAIFSILEYR